MNITLKRALAHFFPNPSFEFVYSEAVANAIDAGAKHINIAISLESFNKPETVKIVIVDDGVGFNNENFSRFSSLLEAKDEQHKGLGRLIYMGYFTNVDVVSYYDDNKLRTFVFNDEFSGKSKVEDLNEAHPSGTTLVFSGFTNTKFKSYDNLRPTSIKQQLLSQFLPRFIEKKRDGEEVRVEISLVVEEGNVAQRFTSGTAIINNDDIPAFEETTFQAQGLDMILRNFKLSYLIKKTEYGKERVSTDVVVDKRTIPFKILSEGSIPKYWDAIFLLESEFLNSKADDSRNDITLKGEERVALENIYREEVGKILEQKISDIRIRNTETVGRYTEKYPHLRGYFDDKTVGLVDYSKSIAMAQELFFKDQKEILDAKELTDQQYKKSLDHAGRILTEYILYREKIIEKIAAMDTSNQEKEIHNLIAPMQQTYQKADLFRDRFNTNAWLLDEKFMLYKYALSDENIKSLLDAVPVYGEKISDDVRPDLALVFSEDVNAVDHPVDVVVLELKKKGTEHLRTMEVVEQLRQRARRLLAYYPNKIQRMWFFGLVDFDDESLVSMEESWFPLYSTGTAYYKQEELYPIDAQLRRIGDKKFPVSLTVMSIDSFISDARARNEVFLKIIRGGIKEGCNSGPTSQQNESE